jgi:PAS domain S-box-containing protein
MNRPQNDLDHERDPFVVLSKYNIFDTAAETSYDNITLLAAQICQTPIAYVSFIDKNRQWFKAKVGFEMTENTLDQSFCFHTLRQGSLLVINDLALDPRTQKSGLVVGPPHLRFYAGVLLQTLDGVILGTLCVMDVNPRPEGLRSDQLKALHALAGQIMDLLELRRSLQETRAARSIADESDRRYRAVFESAIDYAVVVLDRQGIVVDWNVGAEKILGWSYEEMCGQSFETFFTPEDRASDIPHLELRNASTLGRGLDERWHLRKDGQRFWASGEMMPLRGAESVDGGFVKILRDKTKQREADNQQQALFALVDKLRNAKTASHVLDAAVGVLTQHIAFDRAGFGRIDENGKHIDIEESWGIEGLPNVLGENYFSTFGELSKVIESGEILAVPDLIDDPRTAKNKSVFEALKLRAAIYAPIVEHGKTVSVFIVNSQHKQNWTDYEINLVRAIADRTRAALARIEAEDLQRILNEELSHRMKNTLMMVKGIANQTLRGNSNGGSLLAFEQRIMALSTAHEILLQKEWSSGRMRALVTASLAHHVSDDRVHIEGEDIELGAKASLSLSLLLNELATNAVKYGAFANSDGRVKISWKVNATGVNPLLVLYWKESGGPKVAPTHTDGFGSKLIGMGLAGTGDANLNFLEDGFEAEFRAPLSALRES